jgi:transketolase
MNKLKHESAGLIRKARLRLLKMHFENQIGHLGGNLSALDAMVYLHSYILGEEDIFVLSKGHAAGALYISLWVCSNSHFDRLTLILGSEGAVRSS